MSAFVETEYETYWNYTSNCTTWKTNTRNRGYQRSDTDIQLQQFKIYKRLPVGTHLACWNILVLLSQFIQIIYHNVKELTSYHCDVLTNNTSDIIPYRYLISGWLTPTKRCMKIIGQPKEERIVHQLQAEIGQSILKQKKKRTVSVKKVKDC